VVLPVTPKNAGRQPNSKFENVIKSKFVLVLTTMLELAKQGFVSRFLNQSLFQF
jgi:hypothetical protein